MFELLGDMSQAEFARRMGVTESAVSRWATNERGMSYKSAVRAALILGCHAEDIYEWVLTGKDKRL